MDEDERTERPTPRRLKRAREHGDVPRAPLLSGALVIVGVLATLSFRADAMLASFRALVVRTWSVSVTPRAAIVDAAQTSASMLVWPLAVAVVLGAASSFLFVGPVWSVRALSPDASRLDPFRGVRRAFDVRAVVPRLLSVALIAVFFALLLWVLRAALPGLLGRTETDAAFVASAALAVCGAFFWRAAGVLVAAGGASAVYERVRWQRRQHMSRRELVREQRETEGEPQARRRRTELHREHALGPSAEEALVGAAIVVCAPGLSVVIRWRDGSEEPPRISLAARGPLAAQIVLLARRARIAVVRDEALAAALARDWRGSLPRVWLRRLARHIARSRS